jgi:hypothetical protein
MMHHDQRGFRRIAQPQQALAQSAAIERVRYTANTPVARALSELLEKCSGHLVLEAVADYCFQHLGLWCFAVGFGRSAEQIGSADDNQ